MKQVVCMALVLALCMGLGACQTTRPGETATETAPQITSEPLEAIPLEGETIPAPTVWTPRFEETFIEESADFVYSLDFDAENFKASPSNVDEKYAKETRQKISTVEEAIAFLDARYPDVAMQGGSCVLIDDNGRRTDLHYTFHNSGASICNDNPNTTPGRDDIVNAMSWLLYDDMEIYTVLGFVHDDANQWPKLTINCIKTDNGYRFVDPVQHMQADEMSRNGVSNAVFPEAETASIDQWLELALSDPWICQNLSALYFLEGGGRYAISDTYYRTGEWETLLYPEMEPVYQNDTAVQTFMTYTPSTTFNYKAFQEMPYVSLRRDMTTQQMIDSANALKEEISTLDDAIDYMIENHSFTRDSKHFETIQNVAGCFDLEYGFFCNGSEILNTDVELLGACSVVNAVTWLLCDDMDISTVIGFRHDVNGGRAMYAANCIRSGTGYQFVDPVQRISKKAGANISGGILPEAQVSGIAEYVEQILKDPKVENELDYLYILEGGDRIAFTENEEDPNYYTLCYPKADPVYVRTEPVKDMLPEVKPENIDSYELSRLLGSTTLTPAEAYGLADAEPEVVKEKVKTAADLLMYMLAVKMGDTGGCYCDRWGDYTWHTNYTARKSMETKLGNCGTCANLANYLLEDDYEEIGFILQAYYPGNGGGHIYNYIKYQGEYYIVDFSWYLFAGYDPESDYPITKVHTLEEFGPKADQIYGSVCLVLAHTSSGRHLPNVFGEEFEDFSDCHYYVPEGSKYTVLYEAEVANSYHIAELPFDKKYYDWEAWE